jgi:hypothetical protein
MKDLNILPGNGLRIKPACRSWWQRGLRRGSAAARFLGLRVRIPPGVWISVPCECRNRTLSNNNVFRLDNWNSLLSWEAAVFLGHHNRTGAHPAFCPTDKTAGE